LLSPNSILPPPSSPCAFISAKKNSALLKMLRISSSKLSTSETAYVGMCLYSHLLLWHLTHTVSVPTPVLGNKLQYSKNYVLIVSLPWALGGRSISSVSATFDFAYWHCTAVCHLMTVNTKLWPTTVEMRLNTAVTVGPDSSAVI
jgi:hypothetical protein